MAVTRSSGSGVVVGEADEPGVGGAGVDKILVGRGVYAGEGELTGRRLGRLSEVVGATVKLGMSLAG